MMNPTTARALGLIADAVKLLAGDNTQDDAAAADLLSEAGEVLSNDRG